MDKQQTIARNINLIHISKIVKVVILNLKFYRRRNSIPSSTPKRKSQEKNNFDLRRYFPRNNIRELHIDESENYSKDPKDSKEAEQTEDNNTERGDREGSSYKGYRARRGRGRGGGGGSDAGTKRSDYHQKQMFVPKNANDQEVVLENCNMSNYMGLQSTKDELFGELSKVLNDSERKTLLSKTTDFYKGRIGQAALFDTWIELLGKRLTFKVFPFFIATCENEDTCKLLDDHFYSQMLKLPRKNNAILYEFKNYDDFFKNLYAEVEKVVISKVKANQVDFKAKNFIMDLHRVFQLIQIIRRLSNVDTASFKFAINFGLSPKTKDSINYLLLHDKNQIQKSLEVIPEHELFMLLKYLDLCKKKLGKTLENISVGKISQNLLEAVFESTPEIAEKFQEKLGKQEFKELNEKKYIETESKLPTQPKLQASKSTTSSKNPEERKEETKVSGGWKADKNFDAKDKFEFPDLKNNISGADTLPIPPQPKVKVGDGNSAWQKKVNPYAPKKHEAPKPVEAKKKIEQDFPTLAPQAGPIEQASYWDKLNKPTKTAQQANTKGGDWDNEEEYYEEEDITNMVVGVAEKKGKKSKGKKTLYLTGGFR